MFFKEKTRTAFLRLAGVSLGVLLVVAGGTLGPGLSLFAPPTEMAKAATLAPDSGCQALLDTSSKMFSMPLHFYFSSTRAGGKTRSMESIFVGGFVYTLLNGKWLRMPVGAMGMDMREMSEEALKKSKNVSCHAVRDESVNGESATVYSVHSENEHGIHDGQIWISKSKGVLLREEEDTQAPGQGGKDHMSIRFDYNNVQAPKVWEALPHS